MKKNNFIMFMVFTFVSTISFAQIQTNQTPQAGAATSLAFIDGSSSSTYNSVANAGKGIIFPRTDLSAVTSFLDDSSLGGSSYNPNRYDGLVVYNTATSGTAGIGSTEGTLSEGYWFYENKTATNNGGTWRPLGGGGAIPDGTQDGNTLYWDGSDWIETDFLNQQSSFVADGGNTLDGPPVSQHVLSTVPREYGLSHSADGNYLYDTTKTAGTGGGYNVQVVDISDPATPVLGSLINLPSVNAGLTTESFYTSIEKDNHIYLMSNNRIVVYDISTPSTPSLVQNYYYTGISGNAFSARFSGDYLYIAFFNSNDNIKAFDISTPGSLAQTHTFNTGTTTSLRAIEISGDILYAGTSANTLKIYNISIPTAPVLLHTVSRSFDFWRSLELISGRYLYAAINDELIVYDVIDPSNPVELTSLEQGVGAVPTPFRPLPDYMYLYRNSLIIGDQINNQIHYIDVSDPAAPTYQYTYTAPIGNIGFDGIQSIITTGTSSYVYAVTFASGMNTIGHDFGDINIPRSVGIGTTTPDHTLTVNGTAQVSGAIHDSGGSAGTAGQVLSTTGSGTDWVDSSSGKFIDGSTATDAVYTAGNVGIGTAAPTNTLHINGNDAGINISDNNNAGNNLALKMYHGGASGKGMGLIWNDNTSPDGAMVIQTLNSTGGFVSNLHGFARNGNVGIGTVSPTQRLHVSGNILASGTITPDYVFEKYYEGESALKTDYKMLSLSEIEAFTRKHKHLPGVPSAKEVEDKGGILINRATEINLEKIEELYLHIIEQQQLIKKLELRIENLEQIK